ncbi:Lmo0779 family protein [Listeria welshimeri]|uniref:Lmo0779 family protein n=1 Tax=Listeria welshimeri TaxID=1643 RepID=UPI0016258859|nr:Lmo0779 family protein [Listeria welshimeri]MBC1477503.1 YobD family protein [Listeria welshimeri]MBC1981555.1 YobD family protein [Listeria welshimeri]MBF2356589.1 YobD family protein [Listeria welshimeri]MBF2369170.1 YobD family protein [Listeria welshimeri]MBF2424373.1 YobD family protein [Listeria welshimeri]
MTWDATNIFLLVANILTILYILYNDAVIPLWKGKTVLTVKLRSRGRWDGYIFVGIIALLFISNTFFREGPPLTSILLAVMGILFIYICFFRSSKAVFKETGLFYALLFFPYSKIERMNLSEDGILVIETNRQRLMLFARSEKDLEKMLAVFTKYN